MILRNKVFINSIILIAASIAGLALSVVLIFEYFGVTSAVAEAVCERGQGGVNACAVVSASRYAAIRGSPLIGDVPTAVLGFVFYSFIASIILLHGFRRSGEDMRPPYVIITALAGAAFLGDIALYMVSAFIIRFVCPVCVMTYVATALILLFSILLFKQSVITGGGSLLMRVKEYLVKNAVHFVIIALAICAVGLGIGAGARLMAEKKESVTYKDRLDRAVRQYETAQAVAIDTAGVPVVGKTNAPAHFTVFFDFTCGHCGDEILILDRLMKKYPGAVAVSFQFLPLAGDCGSLDRGRNNPSAGACIASVAALCAHGQNRFLDYEKSLFDHYHRKGRAFTSETVHNLAKSCKMDMAAFDACFSSTATWDFITRQYREAEKLGIGSTPTLYLNGKLLAAPSCRPDILEGLVLYCVRKENTK